MSIDALWANTKAGASKRAAVKAIYRKFFIPLVYRPASPHYRNCGLFFELGFVGLN